MDGSFYSNCNMAPPLSQWTRFAMERVAYDQNRSVYSQFLSGTDGEGIGSCIVVRISHFGSVRQHRVGAVAAFYPYAPAKADAAGARIVSLHPYSSGYEPFLLYSAYARRFEDGKALYTRFFEAAAELGASIVVMHGDRQDSVLPMEESISVLKSYMIAGCGTESGSRRKMWCGSGRRIMPICGPCGTGSAKKSPFRPRPQAGGAMRPYARRCDRGDGGTHRACTRQ